MTYGLNVKYLYSLSRYTRTRARTHTHTHTHTIKVKMILAYLLSRQIHNLPNHLYNFLLICSQLVPTCARCGGE